MLCTSAHIEKQGPRACLWHSDEATTVYPPFHPSCHQAAPTGSSPISYQFHCCEVAPRMMLLMLVWFQLSQSHFVGKTLRSLLLFWHRYLLLDWVSPAKSCVNKILLSPHRATTTTVWGKAAMVPALEVPCGKSYGTKERSLTKCDPVWAVLLCSHLDALIDPVLSLICPQLLSTYKIDIVMSSG